MAHPNKTDSESAHARKLKAFTSDYGAANPSMMKLAPVDADKEDGPEEVPSFGADSAAAKPRGDRPARRTAAANPLSTYRKGGRVHGKHRADGGDVSSIETANRDQAMATPGRARGGRMKHGKGQTHVNVIVAPQGAGAAGAGAMPPPVIPVGGPPGMPPGAGAAPQMPMPPPRPPMGGAMPPPGLMGAAGAPGGLPPGIMPPRAKGGRVKHSDEAEDRALFKKMFKESEKKEGKERARGGRLTHHEMTAGAATGVGRLEKIGEKPKNAGHPQEV